MTEFDHCVGLFREYVKFAAERINHCSELFDEGFNIIEENATFHCRTGQAVASSPAVREQLSVDACARSFSFRDTSAIDFIHRILPAICFQSYDLRPDWNGSSPGRPGDGFGGD
jgi:hypothetical protein